MLTKVWTLNIWLWLLLYPSVTRKALQTFDCIELLGEFYLRADPAVHCSGDLWWLMAVLASVGVFVTCILAPIALVTQMAFTLTKSHRNLNPNPPRSSLTLHPTLNPSHNPQPEPYSSSTPNSTPKPWFPKQVRQTSRKHASPERMQRSRVALLTNTYKDQYHYWEAVDLTRKLLLTSVVLLVRVRVWVTVTVTVTVRANPKPNPNRNPNQVVLLVGPDTVVQLWFVTTTGLVFLVLFLAISPYRDQAAGRIQLAALVQLEFTYVST